MHITRAAKLSGGGPIIIDSLVRNCHEFDHSIIGMMTAKSAKGDHEKNMLRIDDCIVPPLTKELSVIPSYRIAKLVARFLRLAFEFRFQRFLIKHRPDVVHSHYSGLILKMVRVATRLEIPFVWTVHHLVVGGSELANEIKKISGVINGGNGRVKIIAVSDAVKKSLVNLDPYLKIDVIYNGLDVERIESNYENKDIRKQYGISKSNFFVLALGRLNPEKGHKYFVEAAERISQHHKNISFMIVGDGPLFDDLSDIVRKSSMQEFFHLAGFQNDVLSYLRSCDAFILPSLNESFGLSVLEAMFAGKACIISRVGGTRELLREDEAIFVEPGSTDQIVTAIQTLVEDSDSLKRLAKASKESFQKFSLTKMVGKYENVYQSFSI